MNLRKALNAGMFLFAAQRICTWHVLRTPLSRLIAKRRPQRKLVNANSRRTMEHIVRTLEQEGYFLMPEFADAATVQRIHKHLEGALLTERFGPRRSGFTIDTVPENVHVAEYATDHLLRSSDIVALMCNQTLIDIATLYLGCKPTISNVSVWWSLPADGTAQEAENYHRDVDDWRFLKFFLYLTDVTDTSGPHRYVAGSHRSSSFLMIRRLTDSQVETTFGKNRCLSMTGSAGDAFLEDTFGLHKGQPPIDSRRLVLQLEYSINPIAVYNYSPLALDNLPDDYDDYVGRLYATRLSHR